MSRIKPKQIQKLQLVIKLFFDTEAEALYYNIPSELKREYSFHKDVQKSAGAGYYLVGTVKPKTLK